MCKVGPAIRLLLPSNLFHVSHRCLQLCRWCPYSADHAGFWQQWAKMLQWIYEHWIGANWKKQSRVMLNADSAMSSNVFQASNSWVSISAVFDQLLIWHSNLPFRMVHEFQDVYKYLILNLFLWSMLSICCNLLVLQSNLVKSFLSVQCFLLCSIFQFNFTFVWLKLILAIGKRFKYGGCCEWWRQKNKSLLLVIR